jgi:hypothetical protein
MEIAMQQAWENTEKSPIAAAEVAWKSTSVMLPLGKHLVADSLTALLSNEQSTHDEKFTAAKHMAWLRRTEAGYPIQVSSLRLDKVWLLNLPGELFIEYQLAAQKMRPDEEVCTAAYEEYGPGYIGTEISYSQGGYETSERASRVAPEVEGVLMQAIQEVLQ